MTLEDIIVSMAGIKFSTLKEISENISSSEELMGMTFDKMNEIGINSAKAKKLISQALRQKATDECEFLFKNNIKAISIFDEQYPQQLKQCNDAPYLIYVRGDLDFNLSPQKYISFVGTRNSTTYGEDFCDKLIFNISQYHPDAVIVSGLSYGIDTIAHKAAVKYRLKTIGVVANGLETIQPTANFDLADKIIQEGGAIISEYPSKSPVFKHNFLQRNRIVAGISNATIIIESPLLGGSMITASLADGYERDIFAVPGRAMDSASKGCNNLIKSSKAQLLETIEDLEYHLGWDRTTPTLERFAPELIGVEKKIFDCFDNTNELTDQEIMETAGITAIEFFQAVTMLEVAGIIKSVRGKLYIKL